jgi:hypothetical protein
MHMPVPREPLHDDQLVRHLLGSLSEDEAQRLEEVSIVDDEVAARLRAVEDELVDAYARGSLRGERLERFETFYLASPLRREKVAFAKQFVATIDDEAGEVRPRGREFVTASDPGRRGWFPWTLAAAAALFLATGLLLVRDVRLRADMAEARDRLAAAERRAAAVSSQLADEQRASGAVRQALVDARAAEPAAAIALLLMPQTRGVEPVTILAVPAGAKALPLDLKVETAGAGPYSAALRDPATNAVVWRSATLAADGARRPAVVPVRVPAALLKPQHYALALYEVRAGKPEFVSSYAFEIVRQ